MHHLGFLERCDSEALRIHADHSQEVQCCFPLPFGLDISVDVETLVAAIEGCLSDIDLSVNEIGFLLLVRRFWPNGMLSTYTFRRLAKAILQWILSEVSCFVVAARKMYSTQYRTVTWLSFFEIMSPEVDSFPECALVKYTLGLSRCNSDRLRHLSPATVAIMSQVGEHYCLGTLRHGCLPFMTSISLRTARRCTPYCVSTQKKALTMIHTSWMKSPRR